MIVQYTYSNNGATERQSIKLIKSEPGDGRVVTGIPNWAFYAVKMYARQWDKHSRSGQYRVVRKATNRAGVKRLGAVPPKQDVANVNQAINRGIPI